MDKMCHTVADLAIGTSKGMPDISLHVQFCASLQPTRSVASTACTSHHSQVQAITTEPLTEEAINALVQQRDRLLIAALRLRSGTPAATQHLGGGFRRRPQSARAATRPRSTGLDVHSQLDQGTSSGMGLSVTALRAEQPAPLPLWGSAAQRRPRPQSASAAPQPPATHLAWRTASWQRSRPRSAVVSSAAQQPTHVRLATAAPAYNAAAADVLRSPPRTRPHTMTQPQQAIEESRPQPGRPLSATQRLPCAAQPSLNLTRPSSAFPARSVRTRAPRTAAHQSVFFEHAPLHSCLPSTHAQPLASQRSPLRSASASPEGSRRASPSQRAAGALQPLIVPHSVEAAARGAAAGGVQPSYTLAYSLGLANGAEEGGTAASQGTSRCDPWHVYTELCSLLQLLVQIYSYPGVQTQACWQSCR